jgi:uncharacterized damage-inducible protein DinB
MKTMDLIRWALKMTDDYTSRLVADMHELPLTQPTSRGGNHPLWVLGHLAVVEGSVPQILFGEPNPVEHWALLFGQGTKPTTDATLYPSFDDVLKTYRKLRAKNVAKLEEIGEAGLDRAPKSVPPGFENEMRTIGQTLSVIALHQMFHLGQIADARRAAGKEPHF